MINLIDLILIVDNVLSDDESELLISDFETKKSGKERSREIDSSEFLIADTNFTTLNLKDKTHQIVNDKTNIMVGHYKDYVEKLGHFDTHGLISNLGFAYKYRILKYGIGQTFHDHVDKSPFIFGSCSLALNDDYEGGEYRFFRGGHKVKLKKGQGMIWPADYFFVHGVDIITKGCKYSVNSFLGESRCVEIPQEIMRNFYHKSAEESYIIRNKETKNF